MFSIVLRFAVTVAAIPLCATYYPGVHMQNLQAALIAGAALGAFYALLRPLARLLLKIINFLTLGLIYILIDTWLVWTVAGMYPDAIAVDSFLWAAAVAASVNIARMIIDIITRSMKR
ncbi:MAG TPA: phage holin family protein [Candidatus Limiplasma sp.]|nr:phage holin family protein [Candidatus Limiplasma sp.]HRX07540.1 phage holin family protein [Candidatus Limiplasma sp.]